MFGKSRQQAGKPAPTRQYSKLLGLVGVGLLATVFLHGEMQQWVQHLPSGDWLKVFLNGTHRRPPAETRPALTQLITANPKDAALYRLRAQEAELQLDFTAAESDWRRYVQLSPDSGAAWLELADYFDRRHQPSAEVEALRIAGGAGSAAAFERALRVISEQALPDSNTMTIFRAWIQRYPQEPPVRQRFIGFLASRDLHAAADEQLAAYKKSFPSDTVYPVKAAADLATNPLVVYERGFQPLWPDELINSYFKLADEVSELRALVARSRVRLEQNPDDFREAGRLFLYWRRQNNAVAARRVLDEYKLSKQSRKAVWKPDELYTVARLYERLPDVAEAAGLYYTLYSLPGADGHYAELSLTALANLLLSSPEQPIRFGSSDLSFYKDIATMDRSPGFLNGILSLILNGTGPRWEYARENSLATAYFHRSAASELVDLLDRKFPHSASRAGLHAQLIQAYNIYGDDDEVIRGGRAYLAAFPRDGGRVEVAMTVADALARRRREREEFALYDQMLAELGKRADGVPLGANAGAARTGMRPSGGFGMTGQPGTEGVGQQTQPDSHARSSEYARILDRYLARLSASHRTLDAVRLYRHEIDRNPNDPGLYERLAAYLDQNNMAAETEAVYKQAMAKFNGRDWYEKLARWYLRRQEAAEAGNLTHQVVEIFSGTELERYFTEIVSTRNLGGILYTQMNLYAHQRFPEDLVFVHNLLSAYGTDGTRDDPAAARLLQQYWYYDPQLRNRFFEGLSRSGKLAQEIATVRAANPEVAKDLAAAQFLAEGEAWRSHFEDAAPALKVTAEAFPGDRTLTSRASSIYRSLATLDAKNTPAAVALARHEARSDPRDRETLATIGDIFADHERLAAARPSWDAMPSTAPGTVAAWRDAATIFWDYYLYDDALRVIRTARTRKDDPALLAYEAGAIYEGKRQEDRAVGEYISGYLDGDSQSEIRLLKLARRPALRNAVDRLTADAANPPDAEWKAIWLRVEVLRAQQRSPEIDRLLLTKVAATRSPDLLRKIEAAAGSDLPDVRQQAMEREIAVTQDPVEQARLRIALVRFFESRKDFAAATRTMESLYGERPQILGVVRATVDYYTRNQQPKDGIRVLAAAAGHANDQYRDQFTLEAARLATEARDFEQARGFLQPLLQRNPYDSRYLSAMGNTFLQAGDDTRFRDFEVTSIKALRTAPLTPADRIARVAALRRDLIPALSRLKDYAGALDQYIEVIDAYPEDDDLIREASLYAARHALGDRLTSFYRKTIAGASRDYRWPMVLARVDTALENFPAAIAAYDAALKARPDRKDLLAEREALEERSIDFERAIASCQALYELSYHDPQWMQRSASLKARLGRREDAIHDLRTAIIGEAKETAEMLMRVATQLDEWNYTAEAAAYADRASKLTSSELEVGAWARIMVRARKLDQVLALPKLPDRAIAQAGQAIRDYYTPGEKAAAEAAIRKSALPGKLALAENAEFAQLQSDLLNAQLMGQNPTRPDNDQTERALVTLETRRTRFVELGKALESYAQRNVGDPQVAYRALVQAEDAWRGAGDRAAELRVLGELSLHRALTSELQERYFSLLEPSQRDRIVTLARQSNPAVAFAVRGGDFAFARRAVQARGTAFPPVWTSAYTALTGLYDDVRTPQVDVAFQTSLGGGTIGERVRHRADPKVQIVGSVWFYYGARYGEYLDRVSAPNARDYLPAAVEAAPGNPNAYFDFGSYYEQGGKANQAIEQYEDVLQLDADRGDAENAIARVLWHENRQDDAMAHWRAALAAFYRVENRGVRVPETFWNGVTGTIEEIGRARQITTLRPDFEKLLGAYANINGAYRTYELLSSALHACLDSGVDYGWVLAIGADNEWLPDELLNSLTTEFHLTADQQEEVAKRRIDIALRHGHAQVSLRFGYIDLLLQDGRTREARREWEVLTETERRELWARRIELKLAALDGTIAPMLERYRKDPNSAPDDDGILEAADFLRQHDHREAARTILEFFYQRELDLQHLASANFLGLAGVYLESGETDRAVQLLRRMNLVSGEEFDTFVPAAALLTEHGKTAEAIPFLRDRVKAVPWDHDARLQLARLLSGEERNGLLTRIVQNAEAPYAVRAAAAGLMGNPAADASTELGLLQRGKISASEAGRPFYVEARRVAGLFREALAIRPSDANIRLETLRAALAAKQDSLVIAILPGVSQEPFLGTLGLSEHDRAEIARDGSMAFERQGNLASAINYTRIAIRLGLDLASRQEQLEAEETRQAENARRAPAIRDNIEQDHVVKARVPGRAS